MIPTREDIENAYERVRPYVHRTPVLTSTALNDISGAKLFFKCENFQRTGSFKMRGAINAIHQLSDAQKEAGVVTHSSGNFAQALSLAARTLGVPAYIVMPSNAPSVKKEAVKGYAGQITESEPTLDARESESERIQKETGATFVHPSNDINVILGQGTSATELLQDHPDLDIVITPVGGGGLVAGCSLSAYYLGNECKTLAGEPKEVDDAWRSLQSGKIEKNSTTDTIADGLRTHLGDKNFPIIQKHVSEIITVEEDEIRAAMKLIWERMKMIIEPSSAVPVAAVLKRKEEFAEKRIGIIISGGNVDLTQISFN